MGRVLGAPDEPGDRRLRRGGTLPPPEPADPATTPKPRCPRCRGATYAEAELERWRWHCRMCGWESADFLRPARARFVRPRVWR